MEQLVIFCSKEAVGRWSLIHAVVHALSIAGSMTWAITWALILGFALSAVVQALVRRSTVVRLLGDDRPDAGARDRLRGGVVVVLVRGGRAGTVAVPKGANFTAAMAFEIASTNLVIELGVILALLMGWQFTPPSSPAVLMIVLIAVLFRLMLRERLLREAREQADRGMVGSMEGHAAMDMSSSGGSFATAVSRGAHRRLHVFVMEWAAIIRDLVGGLLVAGRSPPGCPTASGRAFFLTGHRWPRRSGDRSSGQSWRSSRSSARSGTCRWRSCCGRAASASAA